jgi:hypothetical protein
MYVRGQRGIEIMKRAVKIGALPEGWKYEFQQKINELEKNNKSENDFS